MGVITSDTIENYREEFSSGNGVAPSVESRSSFRRMLAVDVKWSCCCGAGGDVLGLLASIWHVPRYEAAARLTFTNLENSKGKNHEHVLNNSNRNRWKRKRTSAHWQSVCPMAKKSRRRTCPFSSREAGERWRTLKAEVARQQHIAELRATIAGIDAEQVRERQAAPCAGRRGEGRPQSDGGVERPASEDRQRVARHLGTIRERLGAAECGRERVENAGGNFLIRPRKTPIPRTVIN